jgi:hypothetical protein
MGQLDATCLTAPPRVFVRRVFFGYRLFRILEPHEVGLDVERGVVPRGVAAQGEREREGLETRVSHCRFKGLRRCQAMGQLDLKTRIHI